MPAARSRATGSSSRDGTTSRKSGLPQAQGRPATVMLSLIVTATPSSGESGTPARQRASLACAAARAPASSRAMRALSCGFSRAMRASTAASASTGESAPRA